jgi:hypothetical protein
VSTLAVSHFNAAVEEMLDHLKTFLLGLPGTDSTLALVEATERPVGVGAFSGNVERGPLAVLGMRGGRVEARVRFDVVAPTPADVATAVRDLQMAVLGARLDPRKKDFLVLEPAGGAPANPFGAGAWRESVEYRALYEYRYEDPEDAGGLIVSIPVKLRGEHHEQMDVTRDLTRWSAVEAPPLRIRGPRAIGTLSALTFKGGGFPAGKVTLRCSREGAVESANTHDSLDLFAKAVANGGRNDQVVLELAAFLTGFSPDGMDVALAGLGKTSVVYQAWALRGPELAPTDTPTSIARLAEVRLASPDERLEVIYDDPTAKLPDTRDRFPGSDTSVVYLRAGRGSSA